jgi:hypothetical protein
MVRYLKSWGENETDSKIPCETSGVTMESSPKVVPQFKILEKVLYKSE